LDFGNDTEAEIIFASESNAAPVAHQRKLRLAKQPIFTVESKGAPSDFGWRKDGAAPEHFGNEPVPDHPGDVFENFIIRKSEPDDIRPRALAENVSGEYVLWFGTNRKPIDPVDFSKGFSADIDETATHYGRCSVFIPKSHIIGGSSFWLWFRILLGFGEDPELLLTHRLDPDAFWRELNRRFLRAPLAHRQGVVFVHGYNVSFERAALCAAQIGFDLSIAAPMAFFSWPSRGDYIGYLADEDAIRLSAASLAAFLRDFSGRSGATKLHIIAHSMGNRGVLDALKEIAGSPDAKVQLGLGQLILAAADVDTRLFKQLFASCRDLAARSTLYVSGKDQAVALSSLAHKNDRAGFTPPPLVVKSADTIDVERIDLSLLGHGYIGEARPVIHDMHTLIMLGTPPENRFGLEPVRDDAGDYWRIRA
jgi:esterase/lipase superfamily enzyme